LIKITSEKIILFYPAFIYKKEAKDLIQYEYELDYISQNNVSIIGNEYNKQFVQNSDYFIWYMKFSQERIDRIHKLATNVNDVLIAEDYYINKMNGINIKPFSYNTYKYYRYDKKTDKNNFTDFGARYYENIGKLVFEFVLLDKISIYLPKNKNVADGMTEFMNSISLNDDVEYKFEKEHKSYFEEKLYMKKNDELLTLF